MYNIIRYMVSFNRFIRINVLWKVSWSYPFDLICIYITLCLSAGVCIHSFINLYKMQVNSVLSGQS